jgi:hypothetical protein
MNSPMRPCNEVCNGSLRIPLTNVLYLGSELILFEQYDIGRMGEELMSRNPFRLSDEQWARIELHLLKDVHDVERSDERRVISGSCTCSGAAVARGLVLLFVIGTKAYRS